MGDSSLEEVGNKLCQLKPGQFSHLISHRLPKKGSPLSELKFIDATYLYRQKNLPRALPGLTISSISFEDVNQYSECISIFLSAMDRTLPISISVHEQMRYFWDLIGYYNSLFEENKEIDSLLYDNTPHLPWDICLFYVAKALNKKVIIVRKTGIRGYLYIDEDFRPGKTNWKENYENIINPLKSIISKNYFIEDLRDLSFSKGQINGMWPYSVVIKKVSLIKKIIRYKRFKRFKNFLLSFIAIVKNVPNNKCGASESSGQNTVLSGLKPISRWRYYKLCNQYAKHINDCEKAYKLCITKKPNLEEPFVYLPLHLQPERTTMPEGLYFDNQILMIRMLAAGLPDGWKIIVKEHPRQMVKYDMRSRHARSTYEYHSISKIENVIIVPVKDSHDQLVNKCKLTATISGSVSWEGLLIGKPSLIFSENWHANCKSTVFVRSEREVHSAIEYLRAKTKERVEIDVCSFVKDIHGFLVNAALNNTHLKMFFKKENKYKSAENLSSAILQRLIKQ